MSWPSTVWILTNAFDPECIVPAAHVLHERVAACMITRALGCTRKGPRRSGGPSQCVWLGDQPVNFAFAETGGGGGGLVVGGFVAGGAAAQTLE